jgi:hypothetical protein
VYARDIKTLHKCCYKKLSNKIPLGIKYVKIVYMGIL